jgi:hypothetical protein
MARFIARFFPGTVEEYYATRELQRREFPKIRRLPFYIIGSICYLVPTLVLLFSGLIPFKAKLLLGLSIWGMVCMKENMVEHYCLLLLRGHGNTQSPNQAAMQPTASPRTASLSDD